MKLICAYFDTKKTGGMYTRMAKVWEYSARKNGGGEVDLIELEPVEGSDPYLFDANHAKLLVWRDYVREHDDDVVLMDADTVVMGDLREAFKDHEFDVAITTRDYQTRFTMNGGVVFVRNTEKAQQIIDEWYESDCLLQGDRVLHEKFRRKYGGMNQSSYGHMRTKHLPGKIAEIPCSKYNQVEWHRGRNVKPLVIHVKSYLRNAVFSSRPTDAIRQSLRPSAKAWRDMEAKMLKDQAEPVIETVEELPPEAQEGTVEAIAPTEPYINTSEPEAAPEHAPLQIIGIEFSARGACDYKRLAAVWKYSAEKAHPWAKVKLVNLSPPSGRSSHQARNGYKLKAWNKIIQEAKCNTIFMDVDMVVYHPIDDAFEREFDVCYTERTKTRMPLNGGVLFVKPTEAAREFFKAWQKKDTELLIKRNMYMDYVRKYGGQNQASFGWMLENGKYEATIDCVECTTYNCCNEEWPYITDDTRVVHYKGALKRICSRSGDYRAYSPKYEVALKKWKAMEKEMLRNGGQVEEETVPTIRRDSKWQSKKLKPSISKDRLQKGKTAKQKFPVPM